MEHRAFGLGIPDSALPSEGRTLPASESDFMDAGVAAMWYIVRRGTGIFYQLGRAAVAPGKNAMVALLLQELAADARQLDGAWRVFAGSKTLFRTRSRQAVTLGNASRAPWRPANGSGGAVHDAERVRATANGSRTCEAVGLRWCRCRFILSDQWDEAMVWLARALGYDTLVLSATLLPAGTCTHPVAASASQMVDDEAPTFVTAYPELVDVRPLADSPWSPSDDAVLPLFRDPRQQSSLGVHTLRKRPAVAAAWIARMRSTKRLTLRDPLDPGDTSKATPCNFSVTSRMLDCKSHISALWPQGRFRRCSMVMCGQRGMWVRARHGGSGQSEPSVSGTVEGPALTKEHDSHSYLRRVYPTIRIAFENTSAQSSDILNNLDYVYQDADAEAFAPSGRRESASHSCFRPSGLRAAHDRFEGLLPCASLAVCLKRAVSFEPSWVRELRSAMWVEVAHVAFGDKHLSEHPVNRTAGQTTIAWGDFLDPGGAVMWYHYARGTGIFLHVGRMLVAASKNEAVARMLEELPESSWPPPFFTSSKLRLCNAGREICGSARQLASRVRATGNGSMPCEEAGLALCRDSFILGDGWDGVLLWLGREALYDTLCLYASLVHELHAPSPVCAVSEIVDLRIPNDLEPSLAARAAAMLNGSRDARKHPRLARAWGASMVAGNPPRLTLRDPLSPDDERRARPCRFRPARALACHGHVSEALLG